MSYIRANEFTLQMETVEFIYQHGPQQGYTEEQIEEYLAAFDREFLKAMLEIAQKEKPDSIVTKDLEAFIHGHAYGFGTRFCLLRYGRG